MILVGEKISFYLQQFYSMLRNMKIWAAFRKKSMNAEKITTIKQAIKKVLLETGLDEIYPFPVERLANMLGYDSYYFLPSDNTRHISGAVEHDQHRILINQLDPVSRQLFTLAHEIGHIILHKNLGNKIDFRSSLANTNDPTEKEANRFAAELLMPEDDFKAQWRLYNQNSAIIASFFGVSRSAVEYRAATLKL
jgi:Zn-dependent peptidase ImmA (M78 family)